MSDIITLFTTKDLSPSAINKKYGRISMGDFDVSKLSGSKRGIVKLKKINQLIYF